MELTSKKNTENVDVSQNVKLDYDIFNFFWFVRTITASLYLCNFFSLNIDITPIFKKKNHLMRVADAVSSNFICMKINREHSSGSLLYKPNTAWAHIQTVSTYLPTLALSHTCVTYRTHCEGSMIANWQTSCLHHYCTSENDIILGKFLVNVLIISYLLISQCNKKIHLYAT